MSRTILTKEQFNQPCSCHEHIDSCPTNIGSHYFTRIERPDGYWAWVCRPCKAHGQYQGQSPSVSYHGWLRHIERSKS